MKHLAYVGIGSNLGDPVERVRDALRELGRLASCRLEGQSSLYRSAPQGGDAQPDYINAVACLGTTLSAGELLADLLAIEARQGRTRPFPNAPRSLDLDLLLFDDARIDTPLLRVPHPRMQQRAFVLIPLLEIAPQIDIPALGSARTLLSRCDGQAVERCA